MTSPQFRFGYERNGKRYEAHVVIDTGELFEKLVRRLFLEALTRKTRTATAAGGVIKVVVTGGTE